MHRFALVLSITLALVVLSATTASASTTVLHFKGTIPYTLTHPAGGICDFTFVDSGTIDYNQIVVNTDRGVWVYAGGSVRRSV